MLQQRTVKSAVTCEGVGLHSGAAAKATILPAAPGSGLVFVRTDLSPRIEIPARAEFVRSTNLATTLGNGGVTLQTVEHLLAALYGLGIDNARIEVDGPELPVMDGSARCFVEAICQAGGTVAQRRPKRFIVVRRPVEVLDPDLHRRARLEPASSFQVRCMIDFDHPLVSNQRLDVTVSDRVFVREIAKARTFGFAKDIEAMYRAGLARGGSIENAVVIDDFSIRNPEGLRFPDEFVRHKVLDAIGDMSLVGAPLIGRYVGVRSGHALNTALVAALLADVRAYEILEFNRRSEAEVRALELPDFNQGRLLPA